MEFETDPHVILLSSCEFLDNQHNKSHILLKDIHQILPTFCTLIRIKFRTGDVHETALTNCELSINWCSEGQNLLSGINKFLSIIS
jgi:hypothetical protein